MMHDRCVRQRLDGCHAHERLKLEVARGRFVAMRVEKSPEQRIGFIPHVRLHGAYHRGNAGAEGLQTSSAVEK